MFEPKVFFDLKHYEHQQLFHEDQPIWTVLDRLPAYIDSFFNKSWPLANTSGQIEKTLVIHNGTVRDDLEVKPKSPKGKIQVYEKDKILDKAGACDFTV